MAIFVARSIFVAYVTEKAKASFETKIESLRSDLRQTEEKLRVDLLAKEKRLTTLAGSALAGQSTRRKKIDERKVEALESLWLRFEALGPLKVGAIFYQMFKIEELEKEAEKNQNLQQILKGLGHENLSEIAANAKPTFERIYVPDIVWAIYSAQSSILFAIAMHLNAMSMGLSKPGKLISWDKVQETVKAVLPHQSEFLDEHGETGLPFLLDEIERLMLKEVRAGLEDTEADQATLQRASTILDAARKLSDTNQAASEVLEQPN